MPVVFWTTPSLIGLTLQAKLVALYLLLSPHTTMIGCFRLPLAYAQDDLQMSPESVLEAFQELSGVGFLTWDERFSWALIHDFLKWNPLNSLQWKAARSFARPLTLSLIARAPAFRANTF